jgi:hypothetical protein
LLFFQRSYFEATKQSSSGMAEQYVSILQVFFHPHKFIIRASRIYVPTDDIHIREESEGRKPQI